MNQTLSPAIRRRCFLAALIAALALPGMAMVAQSSPSSDTASEALLVLPDAPGVMSSSLSDDAPPPATHSASAPAASASGSTLPEASHTQKYIEPGQAVPKLSVGDKALLGLRDAVSPFSAIGWVASAGYAQLLNGSPNYGTDAGAFGQRLGAAAIRDISQEIFSDSILAPVFHEDPRYYRMGPSRNFFVRLIYAGTRPIISKTDGGKTIPNFSQLGGNLAGAALTQTYYPPLNRGTTQVLETFGGSVGGSAVGFVVSEFYGDVVQLVHRKQK
jgi:hypothetical protein